MNHLYIERRRQMTEAGFTLDAEGKYCAAIWPKELPDDYPRGLSHPRLPKIVGVLFSKTGSLLLHRTDDLVISAYQERLRNAVNSHSLDMSLA